MNSGLITNSEKMNAAEFILIQVCEKDEFYELARVRPYFNKNNEWDKERGWFCEGLGQNNGRFYEFSLHLGNNESDVKHKFINLGYPVKKFDGEKLRVQ
jgi:hypothetical protein